MTTYRKSMSEALSQVYLGEDNMALLKKAAGGSAQKLKMKDGKVTMDSFTASAIMQVYKAINPKNKKTMENVVNTGTITALQKLQALAMRSIKSGYEVEHDGEELDEEMKYNFVVLDRLGKVVAFTSKEFDAKVHAERGHQKDSPSKGKGIVGRNSSSAYKLKKPMSQKKGDMMINKSFDIKPGDQKIFDKGFSVKEEVELDEAKYDLYHKDFSSAMQHVYKMAKKLHGITIDPKEIDDKVASGPKKPSSGKTNSYRLKGDKGAIQVQVYNMDNKKYELNMYKEEVELDESKKALKAKSEKSGVSVGILSKVYDRGMAAYKTGHRPGTTPQQWALARVNSFLTGGGARKADADLWKQAKGQKEEVEVKEGTWELPKTSKQKAGLKKALSKPIKLGKEGENARNVIGPFIGDDELFDDLMDAGDENPKSDARPIIKKAMKRLGIKEEVELDEEFKKGDKVTVKVAKSSDREIQQLSKKFGNTVSGVVMGQSGKILMVKTDKGQINPPVKDVMKEEVELDEASARADAMRAMRKGKTVDPADVDTDASDDDVKSASKNIMMQLRKSVSLRGQHPVEFMDKKKVKIPQKIAQAVLNKHNSFRKPMDKEKFQAKVSKSHKDLLSALKEELKKKEETILDRINSKLKERKNG